MMATLAPWWRERSQREQLLLAIMAALLLIVGLWLGVLRPLAAARDAAAERLALAETELGDVRAMAEPLRRAEALARPQAQTPLIEQVRRRIAEAGLTAERVEAAGDGVAVRIAAVKPVAILRWLAQAEGVDGMVVEQLQISRNSDDTLAVELALGRRA